MSNEILWFLLAFLLLACAVLSFKLRKAKRVEDDLANRGQRILDELNRYRRTYQLREMEGHLYVTVDGGKRYYEVTREQDGSLQVLLGPDQAAAAIFLQEAITRSHIENRVARGLGF